MAKYSTRQSGNNDLHVLLVKSKSINVTIEYRHTSLVTGARLCISFNVSTIAGDKVTFGQFKSNNIQITTYLLCYFPFISDLN